MKKMLFYIVAVAGLVGCSPFTVKNNSSGDVMVGGVTLKAGECMELTDGIFGLFFGDFPVTITKDDETLGDDEYEAGHLVINADSSVKQADEPEDSCESTDSDDEDEDTEDDTDSDDETNDETEDTDSADDTGDES